MSIGKSVSKLMSRVYFNAAKKSSALRSNDTVKKDSKLERIISSEKTDYFKGIKTKSEATKTMYYLTERLNESKRKIAKLGSAEAVFKDQKTAIEYRKILSAHNAMSDHMHSFSKAPEKGNTNIHDTSRTTTTYDRARKRRMSNFDSWFFGSGKK